MKSTKQQLREKLTRLFISSNASSKENATKTNTDTLDLEEFPASYIVKSDSKNIYDKITEKRDFHYLKDDPLQRLESNIDFSVSHKIALFIYRFRKELEEPFLEILFVKKDNTYVLPEIYYKHTPDEEYPVYNQCSQYFEKITGEPILERYHGFVQIQDSYLKNYIVAVIGPMSTYKMPIESEPERDPIWAITDEVLYRNRIFNTPIREHVLKLVKENPHLVNVVDEDGNNTCSPYLLYMQDATYTNAGDRKSVFQYIYPSIKHPVFKTTYLFSEESAGDPLKIKRFAVKIDNPLYVNNGNTPIVEFSDINQIDTKRTIQFYENNKEIWSIKNSADFIEL